MPSRSCRCRMLRSALSAVSPARSAGRGERGAVQGAERGAVGLGAEVSATPAAAWLSGSRSAACRVDAVGDVPVVGPEASVLGRRSSAGPARQHRGRLRRHRWGDALAGCDDDRRKQRARRAAACRPCRGRSRRRTRAPRPAWPRASSRRGRRRWSGDSARSWIESRSTLCQCRKVTSSTSPKQPATRARLGGCAAWSWLPISAAELAHPRDPLVALVPDQSQPAAGLEHAGDLGQRPVVVEPVEGLRDDHDVVRRVGGRELLGRGTRGAVRRAGGAAGSRASASSGSVACTSWPSATSSLGQLAGAGAELEHGDRLARRPARQPPRGGRPDGRGRRRRRRSRRSGGRARAGHSSGSPLPAAEPPAAWRASTREPDPLAAAGLPRGRPVGLCRRPRRDRRDAARPRAAPYLPRDDRREPAARCARERRAGGLDLDAGGDPRGHGRRDRRRRGPGLDRAARRWRRRWRARRCRPLPGIHALAAGSVCRRTSARSAA